MVFAHAQNAITRVQQDEWWHALTQDRARTRNSRGAWTTCCSDRTHRPTLTHDQALNILADKTRPVRDSIGPPGSMDSLRAKAWGPIYYYNIGTGATWSLHLGCAGLLHRSLLDKGTALHMWSLQRRRQLRIWFQTCSLQRHRGCVVGSWSFEMYPH